MPEKQKELRQRVDDDPVANLATFVAKVGILGVICIIGALVICSKILDSPTSVEAAGVVGGALKPHFPALRYAASGSFYGGYWPTYAAVVMGAVVFAVFSFFFGRAELRYRTEIKSAAGKIATKLPVVAAEKRGAFAGKYTNKILWSSIEDRALIVGTPGTGKTTFLMNQILKSAEHAQDFIAVDIKPELADILRDDLREAGYIVLEIDPISGADRSYNPLADIDEDNGIFELCESIIPSPERDPAWAKAEQAYFRLALLYLRHKHPSDKDMCSLPAAYQLIGHHASAEAFLRTVMRSEHSATRQSAEKMLDQLESSKPAQAGFGSVFDRLSWLSLDTVAHTLSKSDFSLKAIGKSKKPVALFLKFEETRLKTMGGLLSALYGHILGTLIKTSAARRPITLYLDEIGNIPPISGLTAKLNTIRSRNLPTWMYWQSTQQMQVYGQGAREVFFGSADLQIFFRSNDLDTMSTVEKLAGKVTLAKHSESTDGGSVTRSVTSEQVNRIEGAELAELAPGEVITLYKGARWRGEATPHYVDFKKYRR